MSDYAPVEYTRKSHRRRRRCTYRSTTGQHCNLGHAGSVAAALPGERLCLYHWCEANRVDDEAVMLEAVATLVRVYVERAARASFDNRFEYAKLAERWYKLYIKLKDRVSQFTARDDMLACPFCGKTSRIAIATLRKLLTDHKPAPPITPAIYTLADDGDDD